MENSKGLTSNQLKVIAIIAMTMAHVAWTLFPNYSSNVFAVIMHIIGRITAPIMWFFIAEGYYHTRSKKKYAVRLFVLALVSHFAYNFCFDISYIPFKESIVNQTSVAWSLLWGLILLDVYENKRLRNWEKLLLTVVICVIAFPADWSCIGTLAILCIGKYRNDFKKQMFWMMIWTFVYAVVYFVFIDKLYAVIQLATCMSIPLLRRYNGEQGKMKGLGKLFYVYYPAHLALCGLLRIFL